MKLSNLALFNSKGYEIPIKLFFDISWKITEPFIKEESNQSAVNYPRGYVDSDNNFIISNPGTIKPSEDKIQNLYYNGWLIFNPTIDNDTWGVNIEEITRDAVEYNNPNKLESNPFAYKLSTLFGSYRYFRNFIEEVNFETSEKEYSYDISKFFILKEFKVPDESVLDSFWNFITSWYPESKKPYWHFEAVVEVEPVSVGLASPYTIYFLDEPEKNVFKKPYIPVEYDEDGSETRSSLYFAVDVEDILILTNGYDREYVTWEDNLTLDISEPTNIVEPVTATFAFFSEEEGVFLDNVRVYYKKQNLDKNWTDYYYIGLIFFKCQAIGQDERYRTLFTNFGIPDPIYYTHVFKENDPLEEGVDYKLVNRKSKELFLSYDQIFPYVGTYKALINAVKFLGYNDIYFKEWYEFLNIDDVNNLTKVGYTSIDMKTAETLQSKLKRFGFTYEEYLNMRKLNQITMMYLMNLEDSKNDSVIYKTVQYEEPGDGESIVHILPSDGKGYKDTVRLLDFPKTIKNFEYSQEEVLVKLWYLKQWLEKYIIGVNCRIVDITGEGVYFEQFKNLGYSNTYLTSDLKYEYSLTPYEIYDSNYEGSKMKDSSAIVTVSLKEYDLTKFSDISTKRYRDYIKYVHIGDSSNGITEKYVLYEDDDFIHYSPSLTNIEGIQLIGAPISAPFMLDEYTYELDLNTRTGSLIEWNNTFNGTARNKRLHYDYHDIKDNDLGTLFVDENEVYISDPSYNNINFYKNAPYIKIGKGSIRDLSNGVRWNDSIVYTIDTVYSEKNGRYVYRLYTHDASTKTLESNDFFILTPIKDSYTPDEEYIIALENAHEAYNQAQYAFDTFNNIMIGKYGSDWESHLGVDIELTPEEDIEYIRLTENIADMLNNIKKAEEKISKNIEEKEYLYNGRFEYTEENFYEAPLIKLHNYKVCYVKDSKSIDYYLNDELFRLDNLYLEIGEGIVTSNEIPVTSGEDPLTPSENLISYIHFTNTTIDYDLYIDIFSTNSGWADPPIEEIDEKGNYLLGGEQYIYSSYKYKTPRKKFYTIDRELVTDLSTCLSKKIGLDKIQYIKDEWNKYLDSYTTDSSVFDKNIKEYKKYSSKIINRIPINDLSTYWSDKDASVLIDEEWCLKTYQRHCKLYDILDLKNKLEIRDRLNTQYKNYLSIFDNLITINKETKIKVNRLGRYLLTVKGFDNYNDIYINKAEDFINVYGERPEINAYTIYDKVEPLEQLTKDSYFAEKVEWDYVNNLIDKNCKLPKTYRLYGVDCIGDEKVVYDNVSYVYDTFKENDYAVLNNFTNRIYGEINDSSASCDIQLWKQNYNLESVDAIQPGEYYGLVFFNENEMILLNNDPIIVTGFRYNDDTTSDFWRYNITFVEWSKDYEQKRIHKLISHYNNDVNIKAFLINVHQYRVQLKNISINEETGNSVISINIGTATTPIFSKNQVIKAVYSKTDLPLWDWKFSKDDYYIASTTYRIVNTYVDDSMEIDSSIGGYKQVIELNGVINKDMIVNHFYNNYKEKYYKYLDSNRNYTIYKEIEDTIYLTICYANLNPVQYTTRLQYDGWERDLSKAGFIINSSETFLNDYIDSGYTAYNMKFDPVNALKVWNDDIGDSTWEVYKYPQDKAAVISLGDWVVLEPVDKYHVFNNKKKYYSWDIENKVIRYEDNLLYRFINQNLSLKPEFTEKYTTDITIRDIYGNIINNPGISKFFVKE